MKIYKITYQGSLTYQEDIRYIKANNIVRASKLAVDSKRPFPSIVGIEYVGECVEQYEVAKKAIVSL